MLPVTHALSGDKSGWQDRNGELRVGLGQLDGDMADQKESRAETKRETAQEGTRTKKNRIKRSRLVVRKREQRVEAA